ncbi:MAG: LacI family transcriptional regulator [Lachnospiraceae bacterium]|nr:LacI family transcriptional regulator [Lachnospiraceae bacterium]
MKKFWALLLTAAMTVSMLAGCGNNGSDTGSNTSSTGSEAQEDQSADSAASDDSVSAAADLDMSKTVKIGILVSDATTAEALAFRNYYTEYIQKQYNVEMIYSDELTDAAGETSAIDTFITNNCKAIISFSSFDRAAQLEQCDEAGVYYAVATGTLTDEEYETYKGYEHYVGAIGPSLNVEFETGYNMAKHYLDQGMKNFAIFGGAIPYYTEMHIYRAAGMLTAMVEAGGDGANYQGATDQGAILGQIFADGEVKTGAIGDVNILGYVGGYDMDDAWFGKCAQMAQTADLEVILAVGNGSDFFGTAISGTDVKIASVDAYASSYGEAMEAGMLDYLAGKFSASIGPIFIATYRAALGSPIRTADGNALALSQGYWVATGADEFNTYYAVDSSVDSPAYTKDMLDTLLTADYATFENFVSKYSFEETQGM